MEKELIVTARCGNLEFQENAYPYNPAAYQEQYDSCVEKIHQKVNYPQTKDLWVVYTVCV